jgi:hypothetical protein
MNVPMIASYADAEAVFAKARNPEKGKPLKNTYRLIKDGDEFVLTTSSKHVAKIYRNNTIEVFAPKYTPSWLLMTVLPQLVPVKVGWIGRKMAFMHTGKSILIPHYKGITFDMLTGECVSQPPTKLNVNKDKRKEYLRDLRVFKRQFETRLKLGVFNAIAAQIMAEKPELWTLRVRWDGDKTKQSVVQELQSKTVSHEFAKVLVGHTLSNHYYRPDPSHDAFRRTLTTALNHARGLIRVVYGIYEEPNDAEV